MASLIDHLLSNFYVTKLSKLISSGLFALSGAIGRTQTHSSSNSSTHANSNDVFEILAHERYGAGFSGF